MPRQRGSARGSFNRIPSTIRKTEDRKKTPPPPRISSRIRSNPPRRSRSSRPARGTRPRSPLKRRPSSSPGKVIARKSREELRTSIEPQRTVDTPKNRERTPEKKYVEKLSYDGPGKEHQKPSYTKEAIKHINISVPNYYKGKLIESNSNTINRTFHPDNVTLVRRQGKNVRKELHGSHKALQRKFWSKKWKFFPRKRKKLTKIS